MEIAGIYGDQLVKLLKLSHPMQDALKDSRFLPAPSTVKALTKRDLMTDVPGSYGTLTDLGEHVRIHLMGEMSCYVCMRGAGLSSAQIQWASDRGISAVGAIENREEIEASIRHANERRAKTYGTEVMPATPDEIADTLKVDQAAFLLGGWAAISRTSGVDEELCDLGLWRVSVGTTELGTRVWEVLRTAPRFASLVHQVGLSSVDTTTNELPGDAERAWDAENAALEGASIAAEFEAERIAQEAEDRAEILAAQDARASEEAAFDLMLAELFPGDDDPYTTYAELRDQLTMERSCCSACMGEHDAISPCTMHASVEAWVRSGELDRPMKAARVTTASPWKTSSRGKHKSARRNGRTRARQVARTRR